MKTKKKAKKAVSVLEKIEALLSDVLEGFSTVEESVEKNVRDLLVSAKGSIDSAINFVSSLPPSEVRLKPAQHKAKARKTSKAPAAKKKAPAAKKR